MLPAMEKLSTQAAFFFSASQINTAITAPAMTATASGSQEPVKLNIPPVLFLLIFTLPIFYL